MKGSMKAVLGLAALCISSAPNALLINASDLYLNVTGDYGRIGPYNHMVIESSFISSVDSAVCVDSKNCTPTSDTFWDIGFGQVAMLKEGGIARETGIGVDYLLDFTFDNVGGLFEDGVAIYTHGSINVTYRAFDDQAGDFVDPEQGIQVLDLILKEGQVAYGDIPVNGIFNFDFLDEMDADDAEFSKNFFALGWGGDIISIFDLVTSDDYSHVDPRWFYSFNVTDIENMPYKDNGDGTFSRTLNGSSGQFYVVSEPGVLAMFGLGLCLLGVRRRQRR